MLTMSFFSMYFVYIEAWSVRDNLEKQAWMVQNLHLNSKASYSGKRGKTKVFKTCGLKETQDSIVFPIKKGKTYSEL